MNLVIMQPYLFPYIGYFQLLVAADRFVLYDDVQFIKGGWINRNRILVNGQPWMFTVPLDQPSSNRLICEIELQTSIQWKAKMLQTIEQNYQRAPYFTPVNNLILKIFASETRTIADLVRVSLIHIIEYLQLSVELVYSSSVYNNSYLKGKDRVLDICRLEGTELYLNASGGRELYDAQLFNEKGIKLRFIEPELLSYNQVKNKNKFVPGLSIIDVLMNNSVSEVLMLLNRYSLS